LLCSSKELLFELDPRCRTEWEGIAREIGGDKTAEEVKAYGEVFWQRYKEIDGTFFSHYLMKQNSDSIL